VECYSKKKVWKRVVSGLWMDALFATQKDHTHWGKKSLKVWTTNGKHQRQASKQAKESTWEFISSHDFVLILCTEVHMWISNSHAFAIIRKESIETTEVVSNVRHGSWSHSSSNYIQSWWRLNRDSTINTLLLPLILVRQTKKAKMNVGWFLVFLF
jgi:hypothetical protein